MKKKLKNGTVRKEGSMNIPEQNNITSSEICEKVMPSIQPKKFNWKLIYSDEFDGSETIDNSSWIVQHEDSYCDGK